jgi:hypothetical protein
VAIGSSVGITVAVGSLVGATVSVGASVGAVVTAVISVGDGSLDAWLQPARKNARHTAPSNNRIDLCFIVHLHNVVFVSVDRQSKFDCSSFT